MGERGAREVTANGYAILIVKAAQLREYIKNHGSARFTWVNYISIKLFFKKKIQSNWLNK